MLDRIADTHRALVVELCGRALRRRDAANTIEGMARKAARRRVAVYLSGTSESYGASFFAHRLKPPLVQYTEHQVGDPKGEGADRGG